MRLPVKVISGGQTGVDRAALDAAIQLGLSVGGWCPEGRLAEDGMIDRLYPLEETPGQNYAIRTEWNVRDSDGTLILHRGRIVGGTALTLRLAKEYGRPFLCVELSGEAEVGREVEWVKRREIRTLNVAGPRESSEPGIYDQAHRHLIELLSELGTDSPL